MGEIDLHLHSLKSDGELSPQALVDLAFSQGLKIMALTDHDTIKGVAEAQKRAAELGITFIKGLEISARLNEEVHVLGYNVDIENENFLDGLKYIQDLRRKRNLDIIRKLHAHGVKVKVYDELEGESRGRAHIAKLLYEQGYVHSRMEAFDKYIGKNAPCYQNETGISPEEAIKLINAAGGIAVLAHPYRFIKNGDLDSVVERLTNYGLGGVEVYYTNYGQGVRQTIRSVAARYNLICTGGSDYHSDDYGGKIGSTNVVLDSFTREKLHIK